MDLKSKSWVIFKEFVFLRQLNFESDFSTSNLNRAPTFLSMWHSPYIQLPFIFLVLPLVNMFGEDPQQLLILIYFKKWNVWLKEINTKYIEIMD